MDKIFYIYKITNLVNNKVYIGQTINPKKRWKDHQWSALHKQTQYIHRAMFKHETKNFVFEIIQICPNQTSANKLEDEIIIKYDSRNKKLGYNINPGGGTRIGVLHSEATKNKISISHKGKKLSEEHKQLLINSRKGKCLSEETKQKISQANIGKHNNPLSEEHKQKISKANKNKQPWCKGKKFSEEHRKKLSEWQIGKKLSEETKQKISQANIGKQISEENKQALIASHMNKPCSKAHKEQMSKIWKGRTWTLIDGKRVWS